MSSSEITDLLIRAQKLADQEHGISNILQPGIIKELIMAEVLGHTLVPQKDLPDARDEFGNFFEYLTSIRRLNVKTNKDCSFQIDRVTGNNLSRVTRNKAFYFGIFRNHLEIDEVWEVKTTTVLAEVKRQIGSCKNTIAHVNFLLNWLKTNGYKIYPQT